MTRRSDMAAVEVILERITSMGDDAPELLLVALDGRSGAGKSTLAYTVQRRLPSCSVIDGDSFYGGGTDEFWDGLTAAEKTEHVIDWRRQRPVLEALVGREPASWHGYDWDAFDGRLETVPTTCEPADVVILDGVYSARPELADLMDLRVLLDTPTDERRRRLLAREGDEYRDDWEARWSAAEDHYFSEIVPPTTFDLVLPGGPPTGH